MQGQFLLDKRLDLFVNIDLLIDGE